VSSYADHAYAAFISFCQPGGSPVVDPSITDTHFTCIQSEFRRSIAVCQVAMPACTDRLSGSYGHADHAYAAFVSFCQPGGSPVVDPSLIPISAHFTCIQSEFRRSIAVCQVAMPACTDRFPGHMGTLITRTQHLYRSDVSRAGHLWLICQLSRDTPYSNPLVFQPNSSTD
jgi:hypothetical protein